MLAGRVLAAASEDVVETVADEEGMIRRMEASTLFAVHEVVGEIGHLAVIVAVAETSQDEGAFAATFKAKEGDLILPALRYSSRLHETS